MENEQKQKDPNEIGALWTKTSKAGNKFLSGLLKVGGETLNVVVFKVQNKKSEKQPDYRVLLSKPMEGAAPKKVAATPVVEDDDIPF